jgi:hypothetical protein
LWIRSSASLMPAAWLSLASNRSCSFITVIYVRCSIREPTR